MIYSTASQCFGSFSPSPDSYPTLYVIPDLAPKLRQVKFVVYVNNKAAG